MGRRTFRRHDFRRGATNGWGRIYFVTPAPTCCGFVTGNWEASGKTCYGEVASLLQICYGRGNWCNGFWPYAKVAKVHLPKCWRRDHEI